MKNDKQALNLFKTWMVLGPDYQHERGPKPIFPKSIVHLIMQYAQYEDWMKIANDLAALIKKAELNLITQSESWAQEPSLNDAKKWLANSDKPCITESYDFLDKTIMPLIKFIAKSPLVDERCSTVLMCATAYGHTEALKALLAAGIHVNATNKDGKTALMWAASCNQPKAVQALLASPGINVNARNNNGRTALMYAACTPRTESLQVLLAAPGINVNAADIHGRTALMMAAGNGHTEAKQLIDNHLKQETAFSRKIFF